MEKKKISDFYIWKILGVIPNHFEDQGKKIKIRCPLHHDHESSLHIDRANQSDQANLFSSSKCFVCEGDSNYNVGKYWLKEVGLENSNENWHNANQMFYKMRTNHSKWWHFNTDYRNLYEPTTAGPITYDYINVRQTLLEIFDEKRLIELNQRWESQLQYLVGMKEVGVNQMNEYDKMSLFFKVGFGPEMIAGGVKYQPHVPEKKSVNLTNTQSGMIHPFYLGKEKGIVNPDNIYDANILHTRQKTLFLVEGQKDALALRLIGIPAFTIVGGAASKIMYPEFFTNKRVVIIYDNDSAGLKGAREQARLIVPYAENVRVATGIFHDMEHKEDVFDFFFVHNKSKEEFLERLKDPKLNEIWNKELLAAEEAEKLKEQQRLHDEEKVNSIKDYTRNYKIDFMTLFSKAEPHSVVQFNARMDMADASASKSIYLRPQIEILDYRSNEYQFEFNITPHLKKLEEAVEAMNKYSISQTGREEFIIDKDIEVDSAGNDVYKNFIIEKVIDETNLDILEKLLCSREFDQGVDYEKAGVWEKLKPALSTTVTNINRQFNKYLEKFPDANTQGARSAKDDDEGNYLLISSSMGRNKNVYTPIKIKRDKFNKRYTMDFTKVKLYEDPEGKEETKIGNHVAIYKSYLPSHLLTEETKVGAKITVYGGKIKDLQTKEPYVVAWHIEFRNEIDDFEIDQEVIHSLEKFRFHGETLEELEEHQEMAYFKFRAYHKNANMLMHMWESVELTYTSVARMLLDEGTEHPVEKNATLDVMIIGDSTVGKSYTNNTIRELYGVGDKLPWEGATKTSLIGGSDMGNNNRLTLGRIPRNHRGLITLEELSAKTWKQDRIDLFLPLHDLRRDGVVELSRVAGDLLVRADVRMLTISNPINAGGVVVGTGDFKMGSMWSMVKTALDNVPVLTRFSFVYCPTAEEHNRWINNPESKHNRNNWEHLMEGVDIPNRDDYRNKIRWVWSRAAEDVYISHEMFSWIKKESIRQLEPLFGNLGNRELGIYTNSIVDYHVRNIAAAVAASTISTDENYQKVIVKEIHVQYAIDFIKKIYNQKYTGIPRYLDRIRTSNNIGDTDIDMIFGKRDINLGPFWKNKMLTLSDDNSVEFRHKMYMIYNDIYEFTLDSRGNATDIAWKLLNDHFRFIAHEFDTLKHKVVRGDLPPPKQIPDIETIPDLRDGEAVKINWQQAMKRLNIIKQHPTKQFIFSVEPKFAKLFEEIKKEYLSKYDEFSGHPVVRDENHEFDGLEGEENE